MGKHQNHRKKTRGAHHRVLRASILTAFFVVLALFLGIEIGLKGVETLSGLSAALEFILGKGE